MSLKFALHEESLEVVTTTERLQQIGPAWSALWERADGLVFQSHGWVEAWWNTHQNRKCHLRIGLIWDKDLLIAVFPLAVSRRQGVRLLQWAASDCSDYCDILAAPECPDAALERLWGFLCASGGFDLVYLNRILPQATVRLLVGNQQKNALMLIPNYRQESSYRVTGQWQNGAAWLAGQPKKTRQEYRRHLRILDEAGPLEFRLLPPEEPVGALLKRLANLKRKNLAARNIQSTMYDEGSGALPALVQVLAATGTLRFFVLECKGEMIAASVNFAQKNTMMAYVTTYDASFSRGSPGDVLMTEYIQWSFDHGFECVDFLCGAERFKNKLATHSVALDSVVAVASLRGHLANFLDGARHRIRQIQSRLRRASSRSQSVRKPKNT
ncbi:GNAT family N-acetyltransferase [Pseudorhizobium pelagicum]|uniref:Acetyltransferase n=1 Tax=Pseudorhizobium pelagicum TaxID=1509405 RepID=A0A922NW73_9HYPH|nr:GNAT family N-acetyltransferase [Pseudorhizobium pelagicum]KEQ02856.1 acetyltransferase [Pseudorhizobium pelagicum]KEQ02860.1 acetyltransferase [Pseudorhizobium pelagicum]